MTLDERIKEEALKFARRRRPVTWADIEKLINAAYCDGIQHEYQKHVSLEPMRKNIGRNN
jgi:hypothetical protein